MKLNGAYRPKKGDPVVLIHSPRGRTVETAKGTVSETGGPHNSFEISAPQPRILWRLVGLVDVSDTRHLLEDPRLRVRIEDGRKALEAGGDAYDLIETDATWPETAGSGNLYSVEFFGAASRRVKRGGVMCTWAPTPRVAASFRAVFPHALEAPEDEVLIGSLAAIPFEPSAWAARAATAEPYLGPARTRDLLEALRRLRPARPLPPVMIGQIGHTLAV